MPNVAALQPGAGPQQVAQSAPADHHVSFHEVLSALNPLQYLPVIGTIYRAITGDQIPEAVRRIGSLIASALIGGPIGAAINVAVMLAEKVSGIDLDHTGQMLLAGTAPADHPVGPPVPASAQASPLATTSPLALASASAKPASPLTQAAAPAPASAPASKSVHAWSSAQLAAYGVSTAGDGGLKMAGLSGADVLNAIELLRIQGAQTAYGRVANLAG